MSNKILKDKFNEFYLKEYQMLTDAHFQTSQRITSFFQYGLFIFSAPIALLSINNETFSNALKGSVFIFISIIGILVMLYLSQLRAEALLYARSINKIRSNFYSSIDIDKKEIENFKILLTQDKKPKHLDLQQFIYVVLVLAVFDSFYFSFGFYKIFSPINQLGEPIILGICYFILHIIFYRNISYYNENGSGYYKRIIGIDIDGVLNKHEDQFVKIYNKNNKPKISVEDITTLPVSKSGIIARENEHAVFKTIEYWKEMPPVCDLYCITEELKNKMGFKIHIFTWRAWTVFANEKFSIKSHTKNWLNENKIHYNKINFEEGNIDLPISGFSSKYKTRFFYAANRNIKYFIEDNLENAYRLSNICKYVFLIAHKYNHIENEKLPYNIIRVENISEVLEWIKKLD